MEPSDYCDVNLPVDGSESNADGRAIPKTPLSPEPELASPRGGAELGEGWGLRVSLFVAASYS